MILELVGRAVAHARGKEYVGTTVETVAAEMFRERWQHAPQEVKDMAAHMAPTEWGA